MRLSLLALLGLSLVLPACGGEGEEEDEFDTTGADAVLALTGDATNGATVYGASCAACHAADGSGGSGPSLIEEIPELTDEQIAGIILNGYEEMAAQSSLDDQEVADVLAYCRETFGE